MKGGWGPVRPESEVCLSVQIPRLALRGLSKLLGSASDKIAILSGSRGCVWWAGLWCKSLLCLWTLGSPLGLLGAEVFWSS